MCVNIALQPFNLRGFIGKPQLIRLGITFFDKPCIDFCWVFVLLSFCCAVCCLSSELCRSLGSALKDKCLTDANQGSHSVMSSPDQDGSAVMSATMQHFLLLSPPLLSSLRCHYSHSSASGEKTSAMFPPTCRSITSAQKLTKPSSVALSSSPGPSRLFCSRLTLQRRTLSLVLATVQLSTVWVMSKAYQFLSSWSLNKFLLITQGDLKVGYSFI